MSEEGDLTDWLADLGLEQYGPVFSEHNVRFDVLPYLDHSDLKLMGVTRLGDRLLILKKAASALESPQEAPMVGGGGDDLAYRSRLTAAESQLRKVTDAYNKLRTDLLPIFKQYKEKDPLPTPTSGGSAPLSATLSPTASSRKHYSSRAQSRWLNGPASAVPSRQSNDLLSESPRANTVYLNRTPTVGRHSDSNLPSSSGGVHSQSAGVAPIALSNTSEPYRQFKVSIEESCERVMPIVMRRYGIKGDPSSFRLLVQYGDQERELDLDEKPLAVFKELQDAGQHPVFMVREVAHVAPEVALRSTPTPGGVI